MMNMELFFLVKSLLLTSSMQKRVCAGPVKRVITLITQGRRKQKHHLVYNLHTHKQTHRVSHIPVNKLPLNINRGNEWSPCVFGHRTMTGDYYRDSRFLFGPNCVVIWFKWIIVWKNGTRAHLRGRTALKDKLSHAILMKWWMKET